MNTTVCMQSPVITKLVRRLDEYLGSNDIPPTMEARVNFLTKVCMADFTTLNSVRTSFFGGDNELFLAYLDFSQIVLDSWDKSPSVMSIEVIYVDNLNAKVMLELY